MVSMLTTDPEALLAGLDPAQVEAVRITRGPLVVHAGAGSGKTRVVSHRVAYAVATGAVDPRRVLVVTFTDKAAGEMAERLATLGLPGVAARTSEWPRAAAFAPRPTPPRPLADLRAWRSARARADGVPAHVVAHDAPLSAIVEQRPGSPAALRRVKGMGPARLDRYGEEMLAILARH